LLVKSLRLYYRKDGAIVRAVDGVDLAIEPGESVGVVGESGSGKSSLALSIMRSVPPNTALFDGNIYLADEDIMKIDEERFRKDYRWKKIAMVPQSSMNALDPIYTVGKQMIETIQEHTDMSEREAKELSITMLNNVDLPAEIFNRYPFQLSGGQKQRVMIALALVLEPELLIADEPTTALDVVVQYNILRLLSGIIKSRNMTSIYITHDISLASMISDKIAIMYAGRIVEIAPTYELFKNPIHPYTQKLIACIPELGRGKGKELVYIPGTPPSLINENFESCLFAPRCDRSMQVCKERRPELVEVSPSHWVACHHYGR